MLLQAEVGGTSASHSTLGRVEGQRFDHISLDWELISLEKESVKNQAGNHRTREMSEFKDFQGKKDKKDPSKEWDDLTRAKQDIFVKDFGSIMEMKAVAVMREDLGDILTTEPLSGQEENVCDSKMVRFLRGYEDDPTKAAAAYRKYVEYRKDNDIDRLRQKIVNHDYQYPNEWEEYQPIRDRMEKGMRACYGKDHYGNIVTVTEIGEMDVKSIIKDKLEELYIEYNHALEEWYHLELHKLSEEGKRLVGRQDVINVMSVGMFQFDIACYKVLEKATLGGTQYPESSVRITSVGNGWIAIKMWLNIISPFIPARTKMKIRAVGVDFLPVLLESIDIHEIPAHWGGLKNDTTFDTLFSPDSMSKATVYARSDKELRVPVHYSGTPIDVTYKWRLSNYTVRFESYFLKINEKAEGEDEASCERVNIEKMSEVTVGAKKDKGKEDGTEKTYTAESEGELVLRWDNTSSIFRSKEVAYKISFAS